MKTFQIRVDENKVQEERPSKRVLKKHAEVIANYDQLMQASADLQRQANAVMAMAQEKARIAGTLEPELIQYAEGYKDRTMRLKQIVVAIKEKEARISSTPTWTKFRDWVFGKFGGISKDMEKEAREFLQSTKREIPGSTSIAYSREEDCKYMYVEALPALTKILQKFKDWGWALWSRITSFENDFYSEIEKV